MGLHERSSSTMSGNHGSTPAAWTAVTLALVAFCVGGIGLMIGPNWWVFVAGCVILALSGIVGKVMQAMGLGADQ
jgi:uncharacterized protein DUF6704